MEPEDTASTNEERAFRDLVRTLRYMRVVVLTGAGCSTESGIPDYRGEETRRRARNPITFQEFTRDEKSRRRYWARSAVGWPRLLQARPNAAHQAIADLEHQGPCVGVITQNVDRLHHQAGSSEVVELHGALAEVRCLGCGEREGRAQLQERLLDLNPGFDEVAREFAPDGDAVVDPAAIESFVVPRCVQCDGHLKPDVVFFGENVPSSVVERAWGLLDRAEALLVVGSSLAVYSGYRFVKKASERRLPIAIVNRGPTRGDEHAWVKVDGQAGAVLSALSDALC